MYKNRVKLTQFDEKQTKAHTAGNMKKVLIVDDESLFLASLTEGLSAYREEFEVLTANNGRQAVQIIENNNIALVVTDLKMPVMDGFQLLAHLMSTGLEIPVVVMTAFGTPEIEECISNFEAFGYLEKPIDFQILADTIRVGINPDSAGYIKGITLTSFLQLLNIEKKTCFLKIKAGEQRGTMYFSEGELLDATSGDLLGDAAAAQVMGWQNAEIEMSNIFIKLRRRVEKPFLQLLSEYNKNKTAVPDAQKGSEPPKTETVSPPRTTPPQEELIQIEREMETQFSEILVQQTANGVGGIQQQISPKQITSTKTKKQQQNRKEDNTIMANNVNDSISELMQIEGAMAVALVDARSGMALGTAGSGINLDVAAAGNSEVVKSKLKVMGNLGLKDKIEDILISLGSQYHLIRPLTTQPNLFFYLVLNRTNANLAMARFKLSDIESKVEV